MNKFEALIRHSSNKQKYFLTNIFFRTEANENRVNLGSYCFEGADSSLIQ